MAHPNARLTPLTRWELVQTVRVDGYPVAEAARRFNVSRATAHKCLQRYDAGGRAGLEDGKSRPRSSPVQTSSAIAERIAALRKETGLGPHRIAEEMGVSPSTTYAVLRREGLNRLDHLHRVTREIVRYEHAHPGDLLHLDVKKLGRIPPGGGKRFLPEHAATYAETNSAPKSHSDLATITSMSRSMITRAMRMPRHWRMTAARRRSGSWSGRWRTSRRWASR